MYAMTSFETAGSARRALGHKARRCRSRGWRDAVALGSLVTIAFMVSSAPTARAAFPGENGRLALVGSNGISTALATGDDDQGVYSGGGQQEPTFRDAAWSPSGAQIAFSLSTDHGPFQIWVVNLDGTDAHRVTSGGGQQP